MALYCLCSFIYSHNFTKQEKTKQTEQCTFNIQNTTVAWERKKLCSCARGSVSLVLWAKCWSQCMLTYRWSAHVIWASHCFKLHSLSDRQLSLMVKVIPSPDWFVGVDSINLCDGNQWKQEVTLNLQPYDAGTDSGFTFSSPNFPTSPQENVTKVIYCPVQAQIHHLFICWLDHLYVPKTKQGRWLLSYT